MGSLGTSEFEDYVDDSQVIRKRHETGELLLSENQAELKFEALVQLHNSERQRTEANMGKLTPAAMLQVISGMTPMQGLDSDCEDEATGDREQAGDAADEEGVESAEPGPEQDGEMQTLFGRKRAKRLATLGASGSAAKGTKRVGTAANNAISAPKAKPSTMTQYDSKRRKYRGV